ncbi:hypothetical protein ROA7450_00006 [Roseovarius albus]|uniref:Polyketide cyclase / dehydrase and lipid transport n=2 Tax=Roseovarius albus TaxID=1247867 RepID=A0A1X6Y4F4_9RHOB|nr:hypothetical protein ROA7450_00006 [Roseovarius albus]
MKFRNKVDVSAPIDVVFMEVSDFPAIEKRAAKRGYDVQRLDVLREPGPGMVWDVSFEFRNNMREMEVELVELNAPDKMCVVSRSSSFAGSMIVDFLALSRTQTRVSLELELKAQNLTARLMLQSIKLMRSNLMNKLEGRMKGWARQIENSYRMSDVS